MIERVKGFGTIDYFELYHSNYLDNDFWILLLPTNWQFEQLEAWKPGTAWTLEEQEASIIQDFEFYNGRKEYASNVAGAYYAARLAICEHLMRRKKQAGALVFREIGEGYKVPVGIFQTAPKELPAVFSLKPPRPNGNCTLRQCPLAQSLPLRKFAPRAFPSTPCKAEVLHPLRSFHARKAKRPSFPWPSKTLPSKQALSSALSLQALPLKKPQKLT